jgi:HEAT repeat protein
MMLRPRPKVRKLARKEDVKRLVKALAYRDYVTDSQDRAYDLGAAVRRDAALALASIEDSGDVDAGAALIRSLNDPSAEVRRAAATALGARGEKRAFEPLAEGAMFWDEQRYDGARAAALESLGELSEPSSVETFVTMAIQRGDDPERTCEVLGQMLNGGGDESAQRARQAAIRALNDGGDDDTTKQAAVILVWLGSDSVEPLVGVLEHPGSARVQAIEALGSLHDLRSAEALIGQLQGGDAAVRKAAATALGEMSDRRAAQPLFAATNDADHAVREAARDALQKLGPLAVISELDSHAPPAQPSRPIDRPVTSHRRPSWFRP